MSHLETVSSIYEAFGRGDVPAILERMHPEVEWDQGHQVDGIPWMQPRRGREGVGAFFQTLADMEFHRFEVVDLLSSATRVVALINLEATWKPTGRRASDRELHIWEFDAQGRVIAFRHSLDTYTHKKMAGADI